MVFTGIYTSYYTKIKECTVKITNYANNSIQIILKKY